jgi:hypothetical protein
LTECILNNEHCFLAEDAWKPVFQSLVDDESLVSGTSQILVDLSKHFAHLPGLFKDVTTLVCERTERSRSSISELRLQLLEIKHAISQWGTRYNSLYCLAQSVRPDEIVMATHWAAMGIYLTCSLFSARLLGAISGIKQRIALEEQCQHFASQTLMIAERETKESLEVGLGLAQKVRIAEATQMTASEWIDPPQSPDTLDDMGDSGDLVEKWKFVHWCELAGRKTTS